LSQNGYGNIKEIYNSESKIWDLHNTLYHMGQYSHPVTQLDKFISFGCGKQIASYWAWGEAGNSLNAYKI